MVSAVNIMVLQVLCCVFYAVLVLTGVAPLIECSIALQGFHTWVGWAIELVQHLKVKSYKCVLSLTEWCDCSGHHMLLSGCSESVQQWSKFLYYMFRFLQAPKWDLTSDWTTLCFIISVCAVTIAVSLFLYYTELRETWSDCVFMFGMCCVMCSKSISLLYRTTGDLKWLCVHVRYVLCYCSKSISLLYRMVTIILAAWWIMQGKSVACTLLQLE